MKHQNKQLIITSTTSSRENFPDELQMSQLTFEWLLCSEHKTHPTAALATLFTLASAITARTFYTETGASTTLYQILIAKTGAGKNITTSAPIKVLDTIGYSKLIISSKISSIGALDDIFKTQNVAIQVVDEFGDHLGNMMSDKGGYLKSLAAKIKNLYSSTNGNYESGRYSSSGGKTKTNDPWTIDRPCFGLTGITTKTQLFKHLTDDMLHDGFLNRFIILDGHNVSPIFPKKVFNGIPKQLVNHLELLQKNDFINNDSIQITIPLSKKAKGFYHEYIGDADIPDTDIYKYCLNDESEIKRAISIRWRENTIRLATALTAFEQLAEVSLEVLEWCYMLIKHSSLDFITSFENESSTTKYEVLKTKAIQWFKKNKEAKVSLTHLAQKARPFSTLKSKERLELLDDLIESGLIIKQIEGNAYYYKLVS